MSRPAFCLGKVFSFKTRGKGELTLLLHLATAAELGVGLEAAR